MTKVRIFDVFKTLVNFTNWNDILAADPQFADLEKKWRADRARFQDEYIARADEKLEQGLIQVDAFAESRAVLEKLAEQGPIGAYSSGSDRSMQLMLEYAKLSDLFPHKKLVIPVARLGNIPKDRPEAFTALEAYCREQGLDIATYCDDDPSIVMAAVNSCANIGQIYHIDRKLTSSSPIDHGKYLQVKDLTQITH